MMTKYTLLHDDEWDVQVSGGEDQSMMAEVNIFLENFPPLVAGTWTETKKCFLVDLRALEVPKPRVRKRSFSLTKMAFSSVSVRALSVPQTKI